MFEPIFFTILKKYTRKTFLSDLSAGVIVGVVALPLAIAFAIASGVPPEVGLVTAVVLGFIVSFLGGSRVQIGGPSGALIVVIFGIMQQFGFQGVVVASIMAGLLLVIMGALKAGTIIQFMPYPIVVGFTSGIALIIFSSQIEELFGFSGIGIPGEFYGKWAYYLRHLSEISHQAAAVGLGTLLVTIYWPKIYRKIPGSLVAIVLATTAVQLFNLDTETIGSKFGQFSASFAFPSFAGVDWNLIQQLLVPAFTIAMLGAIESLMSAVVADGATGYRHRPNTELMAQGVANVMSPLLGGMAGSGALAKTMTNIRNGGKTPVAGMAHAIILLIFMLFLGKLAIMIPLAALSGVLVVVAYNMSEWRSFRSILLKSSRGEATILLTTFLLTIFVGLNIALPFGIILALIFFVNRIMESTEIEVLKNEVEDDTTYMTEDSELLELPKGVEVFQIKGPFFFGIANKFNEAEKEIHAIPKVRIIRMKRVPFIDATGLKNLRSFVGRARRYKTLTVLSGVTPKTMMALKNSGLYEEIGAENICDNIDQAIERAREIMKKS